MNKGEFNYLVSTAEDYFYNGITNNQLIAMELVMTASRHGIEISEIDIFEIMSAAAHNYAHGKKTRGILGFYPGKK